MGGGCDFLAGQVEKRWPKSGSRQRFAVRRQRKTPDIVGLAFAKQLRGSNVPFQDGILGKALRNTKRARIELGSVLAKDDRRHFTINRHAILVPEQRTNYFSVVYVHKRDARSSGEGERFAVR